MVAAPSSARRPRSRRAARSRSRTSPPLPASHPRGSRAQTRRLKPRAQARVSASSWTLSRGTGRRRPQTDACGPRPSETPGDTRAQRGPTCVASAAAAPLGAPPTYTYGQGDLRGNVHHNRKDFHEREDRAPRHLRARHRRRRIHRQPHGRRAAPRRLPGRHRRRPLQRVRQGRGPHQDHRRRARRRQPHLLRGGRQRPRRTHQGLRRAPPEPRDPLRRLQGRGRVRLQAHRVLRQQHRQYAHARRRHARARL